jgi:hypothetical protein
MVIVAGLKVNDTIDTFAAVGGAAAARAAWIGALVAACACGAVTIGPPITSIIIITTRRPVATADPPAGSGSDLDRLHGDV